MKKIAYIILGLMIASCSSKTDKSGELKNLKKERDKLNIEIAKLEKDLSNNKVNGNEISIAVSVERMVADEFKHYLEVQGLVESDNNIMIPVQSSGLVRNIYVKEGDKVKKGDILAQIDSDIVERTIAEVKTGLDFAKTVFERQQRLWDQKIGSEVQYLKAKTDKESLERKLSTLEKQLEMTRVKAPIDGTIDEIVIKEGELAGAGMGAIRIVRVSDLTIKAALSEAYINDVRKGDVVNVNIPVLNKSYSQSITSVAKVIDPDNRTFSVELKVPQQAEGVKPNMLTVLTINDYTNDAAVTVPINILQNTGSRYFLFKAEQKNGKWYARKQFVKAGKYYNNIIEILEGVNAGDYVVTFGFQQLTDGQLLDIKK